MCVRVFVCLCISVWVRICVSVFEFFFVSNYCVFAEVCVIFVYVSCVFVNVGVFGVC